MVNGGIVESCDYNGLIAGLEPSAQMTAAKVSLDSSAHPAGTVLCKTGSATSYAPVSAALDAEDLVLIAAEEIPSGSSTTKQICCYKAGCFDRGKLSAASTYTLTANDFGYMSQAGLVSQDGLN